MIEIHDPVRHLKYLRQSLSQDNEAVGFFISAGCPLAVTVPNGSPPLIPDVKNLTKQINKQLADKETYSRLLKEVGAANKNIENIEDILSFVRSMHSVAKGGNVRGFSEDELKELESNICQIIVGKLDVCLPDSNTPYHQLCKWVRSIQRKIAIEVFTTNYDLLLEQALEDLNIPYFDGFVGSRNAFFDLLAVEDNQIPNHWSRLWKIHGSINWRRHTNEEGSKVFRGFSPNEEAGTHLIYPSHLKYDESRKMPYLALIDQLSRFIRKKSSFLILSGYSFNDEHINDTIVNALRSNPTGMVLGLMFGDYLDGKEERYPNAYQLAKELHNLNIWTSDQAIIGTNIRPWGHVKNVDDEDEEILLFIKPDLIKGQTAPDIGRVELGNFAIFADFLQTMIGNQIGTNNATQ